MKLAWLTDIHLNFLEEAERRKFYQEIINSQCDALLISGDIAEAPVLSDLLNEMESQTQKIIYFILGNHDYYRGQIDIIRQAMTQLTKRNNKLNWLPASGVQQLNNHTILIGQDGWADGRLGNYQDSRASLNDSRLIVDLFQMRTLGKFQLLKKMQHLADTDAMKLQDNLYEAISHNPKKIIILTHIPPFKETSLFEGKISSDDYLPYFTSKATGDVLMEVAKTNPNIKFLTLCGHTHSKAIYDALPNLTIKVGGAEYYRPEIQEIIDV